MTRASLAPDLTLREIARALGIEESALRDALPELVAGRGFPKPDPLTGRVDPVAFERWRRLRNHHLFPELTPASTARDPRAVAAARRTAA